MATKRDKAPLKISDFTQLSDAQLDALAKTADEIASDRDRTEREIKSLLESGNDAEALALMRKHLNVKKLEP